METLYYWQFNSPVGPLTVAVSERGLARLEFARGHFPPVGNGRQRVRWERSQEKTAAWVRQLQEYFAGKRRHFTLPLDLRGTEFQKRCWRALLEIPYGETRSYGELARTIGRPRAYRAVGMANHQNPLAIVVPCHRVIASDGKLAGYGGGLDVKRKLLQLEGALLA